MKNPYFDRLAAKLLLNDVHLLYFLCLNIHFMKKSFQGLKSVIQNIELANKTDWNTQIKVNFEKNLLMIKVFQ